MKKCIVIGAGMAGLTAATVLQNSAQWEVLVLDKGRGVGGRMATRRLGEGGKADHGAQYFSTKLPDFTRWNSGWQTLSISSHWFDLPGSTGELHPRFIGRNGMSGIPKFMAESLTVKTQERVISIHKNDNKWIIETDKANSYEADALICTIPAPQASELIQNSSISLHEDTQKVLQEIHYDPCFAVMAVLDRPSAIPSPGGMKVENSPIGWISDNFLKGISEIPTLTIHATAAFSQENLEKDPNEVKAALLEAAAPWLTGRNIEEASIHRWRYSLASKRYTDSFFVADAAQPFLMGGDGFGDGNVEGAFLSGKRMADYLVNSGN
ncbi:MAG: NAD(P)/FAD-dependent oxidoreductase [Spirosomataceae bacterium]